MAPPVPATGFRPRSCAPPPVRRTAARPPSGMTGRATGAGAPAAGSGAQGWPGASGRPRADPRPGGGSGHGGGARHPDLRRHGADADGSPCGQGRRRRRVAVLPPRASVMSGRSDAAWKIPGPYRQNHDGAENPERLIPLTKACPHFVAGGGWRSVPFALCSSHGIAMQTRPAHVPPGVRGAFPGRRCLRRAPGQAALGRRLRVPGLRLRERPGAEGGRLLPGARGADARPR